MKLLRTLVVLVGSCALPVAACSDWDIDHPTEGYEIRANASVAADGDALTASTACTLFVEQIFAQAGENDPWFEVGANSGESTSGSPSTWSITVNEDGDWDWESNLKERIRLTWPGGGDGISRAIKFIE